MLLEAVLSLSCGFCAWLYLSCSDLRRIYRIWNNTLEKCKVQGIKNSDGDTFTLRKLSLTKYGFIGYCYSVEGLKFTALEEAKECLQDNLGCTLVFKRIIDKEVCIEVDFVFDVGDKKFEPVELSPYKLLLGYTHTEIITANMEKFSHCLIGGNPGGGKSRLLMAIMVNLIANGNVRIYLNQPIKSDLQLFRTAKCCMGYARTLEETLDQLQELTKVLKHREAMIDRHMVDGIFNISDYNEKFSNSLPYIYVVFEEISLYAISPKNTKDEKELKKKINGYLREILAIGRYVGIFVLAVIQKATSKNLDTDLRDLFNTRIMFKCVDSAMSIAVLGYGDAKDLKDVRDCCILSNELIVAKTYFIDFDIMKKYLLDGREAL